MTTMSPHHVSGLGTQHFERWRRLQEERRFRVEQLDDLELESVSSAAQAIVNDALRLAATTTLREIDAALSRISEGSYGLCVTCARPLPDSRLDVLPMAALCISCHYHEQNRQIA